MKSIFSTIVLFCLIISGTAVAQGITNTLGPGGNFVIKDVTTSYFILRQTDGTIILPSMIPGSLSGSIFKGENRFLHTYRGSGTNGFNIFLGINSGNFTMGGSAGESSFNNGVGAYALSSLTTGSWNSAFGNESLRSNTTGYENSAFGNMSLASNTSGYRNSAFGYYSLLQNVIGIQNSAFGYYSLYANTSGSHNSAFGYESLRSINEGYENSAFGARSLGNSGTGGENSAFGYLSLYSNAGNRNSAFGNRSLGNVTSGSNNIGIGYNSQVPSGTSNNQVRIGDTDITYAGIQVAWTITSDSRYKENIVSSSLGLNFLSKLKPVSYTRKNDEKVRTEFGLIAQEVEEVLKQEGIENSGMLTITDNGMYELRYNDLIAPIIKAIQELSIKNEKLEIEKGEEIAKLKEKNLFLTSEIESLKSLKEQLAEIVTLKEELEKQMITLKKITDDNQVKFSLREE
jgi:hypothetical protein